MSSRESDANGFAARLQLAIGERSVNSFARESGVSQPLLRQYLSGSLPRVDKLAQIARAADVSIHWLATGEGEMAPFSRQSPAAVSVAPADLPKEEIKTWLDEWWCTASAEKRTWLPVQMAYCIPPFADWQKKRGKACSTRCGAEAG